MFLSVVTILVGSCHNLSFEVLSQFDFFELSQFELSLSEFKCLTCHNFKGGENCWTEFVVTTLINVTTVTTINTVTTVTIVTTVTTVTTVTW